MTTVQLEQVLWCITMGTASSRTLSPLRGAFISSEELQSDRIVINNPKLNTIEKEYYGKRYNQITGDEWLLDLELKGKPSSQDITDWRKR